MVVPKPTLVDVLIPVEFDLQILSVDGKLVNPDPSPENLDAVKTPTV